MGRMSNCKICGKNSDEIFRTNLKLRIQSQKLTITEVAKRSGLATATVNFIYNGKRRPLLNTASKIAQGINSDLNTMLLCRDTK